MYRVYASGPDGSSTYPECWGAEAKSRGKLVTECGSIDAAVKAAIQDDRANDIYVHNGEYWEHVGGVICGTVDRNVRDAQKGAKDGLLQ